MTDTTPNLVLIRHGESTWNVDGRATGWADIPLTSTGQAQAAALGEALAAEDVRLDIVFASVLRRAAQTAVAMVDAMAPSRPPIVPLWQLNERHVGQLEGLGKDTIKLRWGNEQRRRWRSEPDALPPPLNLDDPRHPRHNSKFARLPAESLPSAERIHDVRERVLGAWRAHIRPALGSGSTVAVVAHRDSLRVLIAELEQLDLRSFADIPVPSATARKYSVDGEVLLLS